MKPPLDDSPPLVSSVPVAEMAEEDVCILGALFGLYRPIPRPAEVSLGEPLVMEELGVIRPSNDEPLGPMLTGCDLSSGERGSSREEARGDELPVPPMSELLALPLADVEGVEASMMRG